MGTKTLNKFLSSEENGVLRFGGARMALLDIRAGFWGLRRQMEALVGRQLTDNALRQAGANAGVSFALAFALQAGFGTGDDGGEEAFRACVAAYQAAGFGKYDIELVEWPIGRVLVRGQNTIEAWMMQQHEPEALHSVCVFTAGVLVGFVNALTSRQDIICIEQSCQAMGSETCLFELIPASEAESGNVVSFDPDPGVLQMVFQENKPVLESDTYELSTLLSISQSIASTLELGPLLALILNQFKALVAFDGAAVLILNDDCLEVLAYRGPIPQEKALNLRFPLAEAGVNKLVVEGRQPVIIPDIEDDAPLAKAFRNTAGKQLDSTFSYIRSWMGVPLISRNEVVGMLSLDSEHPNAYTQRHSLLARTFADQVAVAIENARLYENEHKRRRELQTLLDVASAAGSSLNLEEMLASTLERLVNLVGASRAGVMLYNETTGNLEPLLLRPDRPITEEDMTELLRASQLVINSGELLYVATNPQKGYHEPGAFLPLRIRDRVVGLMGIIGAKGEAFSQDQLALFQSIADQVAMAMENVRLYEHAEQSAAAAERNRLARELHDAVSQTLFSASLIAEVLPRLWEKDPKEGQRRLEELRELTRGALAEMRALLMELRPATLAQSTLGDLLQQLAEAAIGRSRIAVQLDVEEEQPLAPEVKIAFYRIAQEALHNIDKHAGASSVSMHLRFISSTVVLIIEDNGRGFDTASLPISSLGLGIMRERAAKIGADLTIESQIGEGTTISVRYPLKNRSSYLKMGDRI